MKIRHEGKDLKQIMNIIEDIGAKKFGEAFKTFENIEIFFDDPRLVGATKIFWTVGFHKFKKNSSHAFYENYLGEWGMIIKFYKIRQVIYFQHNKKIMDEFKALVQCEVGIAIKELKAATSRINILN